MDLQMKIALIIESNKDDSEQASEEIIQMFQSEGILDSDYEEEEGSDEDDY